MAVPFHANEQILKLQEIISNDQVGGWDRAWLAGTTPWDVGHIQPPLEDILERGEIEFPRVGRTLVPGCGKGFDAIHIAKTLGLQTTGADISPTAVRLARENLAAHPSPPADVSFEVLDFFEIEEKSKFDLVYDYTFFQALPPTRRVSWGAQMCNIVKPGGYLIILAYPTSAPKDVGPPYGIDGDSHGCVLGDHWDKLVDRVPERSSETHVGRERMLVWRKK